MSALQLAMLEPETHAPSIVLRDYQRECIAAVEAAAVRGVRRQLIVLPTGAGKTIVFATIIDRLLAGAGGRALVLAHRDELVAQAVDKFRMVAGGRYPLGVVKAERNEVDRQILIGSVQTLASPRRLRQLPAGELAAVVIDECFPAGTLVDGRPIEMLRAGDVITAWDPRHGLVRSVVTAVMRRPAPATLYAIEANGREVLCTGNHPFLTRRGWVAARDLHPNDYLCLEEAHADLHHLWKPDPEPDEASEGFHTFQGARRAPVADGLSVALQAGHRRPREADRDRSGRLFAHIAEPAGTGSTQGPVLTWTRLDGVTVHEPAGFGEPSDLCPDGLVYNLEIADQHSYLANGFVVHNCHHAMAATYRRIVEQLRAGQPGGPLLLGFTATPDRGDRQAIGRTVFDELVYSRSILDLIEDGYLCDVEAKSIRLAADLSHIHTRGGDLDAGELATVLLDANAPRRVLEAYQEHAAGRKAIAFTPGVKLAHELARTFRAAGIPAEAADGTTHPAIRRAILARFAAGETRVLCNDSILTEGFDEPSVDCIIMARPTKSRPLYAQIIGRGLRPAPGKHNCLVLDLCGNAGKHDLASVPDVFGLAARGELPSAKEAAAKEREQREISERQRVRDLERGRLVAKVVQLFRRAAGGGWHWVPLELGQRTIMLLSLGDGLLKVGEARPDDWAVVLNRPGAAPRVLYRHLPRHRAQQLAESYAQQHGKAWACRPGRAWRSAPASRKTRVYARAQGIELAAGCTAGEASDAILRHHATSGWTNSSARPMGGARQVSGSQHDA